MPDARIESVNIAAPPSANDARDAELEKLRSETRIKKSVVWTAILIVAGAALLSVVLVLADATGMATIKDSYAGWSLNLLQLLVGFAAGALWPSASGK